MSKKKIFIDAGHNHSGWNTGAAAYGLKEQDITFEVAYLLGEVIKADFDIRLSRPTMETNLGHDNNSAVNARWQMSNQWGADYFISIHCNAAGGTGSEIYYYDASARSFATTIQKTYAGIMGLRDRRSELTDRWAVLRHTNCPAVLLELAFIDSPLHNPDVEILRNRKNEMANAIAKGIYQYFGMESLPAPGQTVAIDVLGNVTDVMGFIKDGATWVRLTDFSSVLGFSAIWDKERGLPVIIKQAENNHDPLAIIDERTLIACEDEINLLKKVVHWEARGEDEKGQTLVANVIFNRINDPGFPDNIRDVLFWPNAFVSTKRTDFESAVPSPLTVSAVNSALSGTDYSQGATFFCSLIGITADIWHERAVKDGRLKHLFDHGNHRFYKVA